MKTSSGMRWAAYAIAAALTAAAMWHVDHRGDDNADAVQPVRPAQRGLALTVAGTRPAAGADALAILKQRLDAAISGGADPFSDSPSVAAAPILPAASQPAAAAAPAEAPPPAVPFTYVGRWQEQGRTVVFLRAGDRVVTVNGPGLLEGNYVVETIARDGLTLKMPDGHTQVLSFDAPASVAAAPAGAAVQAAASTPDAPQEGN